MSFSTSSVLNLLTLHCGQLEAAQLAGASITGKREGLFRDVLLAALATSRGDHLARAEWRIPSNAMSRWKKTRFAGDKAQGIVDLVLVPKNDLLSETPPFAVEFKLWYWFDALNKKKYVKSGKANNHLISNSFLADVSKLRAVSPHSSDGRMIVTVIPTFHTDDIVPPSGRTTRQYLEELGFPYSGLGGVMPNATHKSIASMRQAALRQISNYFERQGCPTLVGGDLRGTYKGVPVTTDFVVSEVPPLAR